MAGTKVRQWKMIRHWLVSRVRSAYIAEMSISALNAAPAFHAHDHAECSDAAIDHAEQLAVEKGLRLTPVRRRVLEILLENHRALGAYDVLERLAADGFSSQPPVAYRALDFLVEHGLAHRVSRLKAFAACMHPGESHEPAFYICEVCQVVAEAPVEQLHNVIVDIAGDIGFDVARATVEVLGRCPACR